MTETTDRRTYLLAVVTKLDRPVTTRHALKIYRNSPWKNAGRSTARRDLLDLARRGHLIAVDVDGLRAYGLSDHPGTENHFPLRSRHRQQVLFHLINREGGEWTVGRVKAVYRRLVGTHVYRSTVRRDLAELHKHDCLIRHGDGTPRRFYTARKDGAR